MHQKNIHLLVVCFIAFFVCGATVVQAQSQASLDAVAELMFVAAVAMESDHSLETCRETVSQQGRREQEPLTLETLEQCSEKLGFHTLIGDINAEDLKRRKLQEPFLALAIKKDGTPVLIVDCGPSGYRFMQQGGIYTADPLVFDNQFSQRRLLISRQPLRSPLALQIRGLRWPVVLTVAGIFVFGLFIRRFLLRKGMA